MLFGGAALVPVMPATPAAAASLKGCKGSAQSLTSSGKPIDTAVAPGPGGTRKNPFKVDYKGTVVYDGSSDTVITNHSWHVEVYGIRVKSGGSKNGSRATTNNGTEKVKDYIPFRFTGLYYVSGGISGTGGSCSGHIWIKVRGNPAGTLPWVLAIVLTVGGFVILYRSRPSVRAAS
jgi:hypothetical protein